MSSTKSVEGAHGIDTHVISADLSVPSAASDINAELQQRGLTVDVLVNNAGLERGGHSSTLTWSSR